MSTDPAVGLQARIEFGPPPACSPAPPKLGWDRFNVLLAKGDYAGVYSAPPEWSTVKIKTYLLEAMPYFKDKAQMNSYETIFSYTITIRNNDGPACDKSTMSFRGHALPKGWRLDEGGCSNYIPGQTKKTVCGSLAIPKGKGDGWGEGEGEGITLSLRLAHPVEGQG